jgi:hypothetical protein
VLLVLLLLLLLLLLSSCDGCRGLYRVLCDCDCAPADRNLQRQQQQQQQQQAQDTYNQQGGQAAPWAQHCENVQAVLTHDAPVLLSSPGQGLSA